MGPDPGRRGEPMVSGINGLEWVILITEPGEVGQEPERRQRRQWATVAMATGVAFAIVALLHARRHLRDRGRGGRAAYSLVHLYTRRSS